MTRLKTVDISEDGGGRVNKTIMNKTTMNVSTPMLTKTSHNKNMITTMTSRTSRGHLAKSMATNNTMSQLFRAVQSNSVVSSLAQTLCRKDESVIATTEKAISPRVSVIMTNMRHKRGQRKATSATPVFALYNVIFVATLSMMIATNFLTMASAATTIASSPPAAPAGCEWRARNAVHSSSAIHSGGGGSQVEAPLSQHAASSAAGTASISPSTISTSSSSSMSTASASDLLLTCHFRNLGVAGSNLSLIPSERTYGLVLSCEDVLFESRLANRSFERLHHMRELYIERCKLSELPVEALVGLGELRQLSVKTHNRDWDMALRLPVGLFQYSRRLETIDLAENGLSQLAPSLFCPINRLAFVNVSDNLFGDVTSLGFSAKTSANTMVSNSDNFDCPVHQSIMHLDVSHNRIKVLTDRGFGRLRKLQILNMRFNQMVRAEDTSLVGLGELLKLDLSNNQLVALPARFFHPVRGSLTELYLQNNSISVIPPGLFTGLSKVTVLDLSHNEVTSHWIGQATFTDMNRLISLDLSNNKLSRIDASSFTTLFTLQSLSLQNNQIESITENAFAANRNLHTLQLSGNRITALDAGSFTGLEVLNALFLDGNLIMNIHQAAFANVTGLMELNLGGNLLETVPKAIRTLHSLRSLDLSHNKIRDIANASYQGLEQLYGLNMEANMIGNITRADFVEMPSLRVLNLASNRIAKIEQNAFDSVIELHALRLDSNQMGDINNLFNNLRDLMMLNISANRIHLFDYALIPIGLQWLDIHANQIENLGNYFEIESELKLRTLDASSNRLTDIEPNSLPDGIELLMLGRNQIRRVAPFTFLKKTNLTRADLSENRLTSLDMDSLRLSKVPPRRPLPEFRVAGNPFTCDCNMEWLQRTAINSNLPTTSSGLASHVLDSRQYPRVVDAHQVQCRLAFSRATGVAFVPLTSVAPSQFLCSYRSHCFALCHCCEFDACDCEMTCPDNCTCYYDQSWNVNIVDCGLNEHSVVPNRIPMDVTDLYLDGNHISELSPHTFIGRKNMRHLYLNSSHIRAINNKTFNGLKSLLILDLSNNELDTLYGYEFERLVDLRELYLQHNQIHTIANRTFYALKALKVLNLSHNRIIEFEIWSGLAYNSLLDELYMGANQWSCECHFVGQMLDWLPNQSERVRDLPAVHCQYNETYSLPLAPIPETSVDVINFDSIDMVRSNISAACGQYSKRESLAAPATIVTPGPNGMIPVSIDEEESVGVSAAPSDSNKQDYLTIAGIQLNTQMLILIASSSVAIIVLLVIIVLCVIYRHEISVWVFARTGIHFGGGGQRNRRKDYRDERDDKLFDAFLSYSKKDESFVVQNLAAELEFGPTPMRICMHYRDLPVASGYVSDAIVEAMAASRRTIMIVTENFLRNEWNNCEFRSAHQEALRGRSRQQLILIFGGPIPAKDLDPGLRAWLKSSSNTCLQWGEKMFWDKLRYAMPEIPSVATSNSAASSSSTASSSFGRRGHQHHGQHHQSKTGTLPLAHTGMSQSPLASRSAIDPYNSSHHQSMISSNYPLLASSFHTTLGRHNYMQQQQLQQQPMIGQHQHPMHPLAHHQSSSHLYSPSSIHSQQSTYAYPTYQPLPAQHTTIIGSMGHRATPPPLPPAHPLGHLHGSSSTTSSMTNAPSMHHNSGHHHHTIFQANHSGQSSTSDSTAPSAAHLHHQHHQQQQQSHPMTTLGNSVSHMGSQRHSSSAESSLVTTNGSESGLLPHHSHHGSRRGRNSNAPSVMSGESHEPFVPSAHSTTAVAVHI